VTYPSLQLSDEPLALALRDILRLLQAHSDFADLNLEGLAHRLGVLVVLLLAAELFQETVHFELEAVGALLLRGASSVGLGGVVVDRRELALVATAFV